MRRLALLGALLVACSSQSAASVSSPGASAVSASPRAGVVSDGPVSASPVSSGCRLAVMQQPPSKEAGPGFLTLPAASLSSAADAGAGMFFYDRQLQRWVPDGPPGLSPDGLRYAYVEGDRTTSRAHLVDLAAGSDRVVASGGPWRAVGLASDAIYVMRIEYQDSVAFGTLQIGRGLWRVPLDGTAPSQLTTDARGWDWVSGDGVFGGDITTNIAGAPNDIVRLDMQTRQQTTWFSHNVRSRLIAVDPSGAAFIITDANDEELWRVTRPGTETEIWSGATDGIQPDGPVAVDGSDVWFSSSSVTPGSAIYNYSAQNGLRQAASFNDRTITVAGPCV